MAQKGMRVAMNGRSEQVKQEAEQLQAQGYPVATFRADISQKAEVEAMMEKVEQELGPLWLLVNNAGVLRTGPTAELEEADWDLCFNVDAKGVFLCSQAAIRRMIPRQPGRIANVSSIAGATFRTAKLPYSSAKAAVNHFYGG